MIVFELLYAIFCIGFAYLNAHLIKKGKRIYHALNGAIHIAAAAAGLYFFDWQTGIAILFVSRLVFDTALNLMRGKAIDYTSPSPKSIVDKIEQKIFKRDGVTPKLIYILLIVVLNCI